MDEDCEGRLVIDEGDGENDAPFQEMRYKNSKHKRSDDSSSDEMELSGAACKKGRNEEIDQRDFVVYMQGTTKPLTSGNPVNIQKSIEEQVQPIKNIEQAGKSLRIFCHTEKQKKELMKVKIVAEYEVTCSEPRTRTSTARTIKVVTLGIPQDMDEGVIIKAADAVTGRRLKKKIDGKLTDTTCMLLEYHDTDKIPEYVYVMWRRFPVRPYHAEPIRCFQCNAYGHTSKKCTKKQPKCSKCAGDHKFSECQNTYIKCTNCKGDHAATSRECPKYIEIKETLNLVNSERLSYKEALLKMRSKSAVKEITIVKQGNTDSQNEGLTTSQNKDIPMTEKSNENPIEKQANKPKQITVNETKEPQDRQEIPVNSQNQNPKNEIKSAENMSMSSFLTFIVKFMCLTKKCNDIKTLGDAVLKLATDCFGQSIANDIAAMMC